MNAQAIRNALGALQNDPEDEGAWQELQALVKGGAEQKASIPSAGEKSEGGHSFGNGAMDASQLTQLLQAARRAHQQRREHEAVARLLHLEIERATGSPGEKDLVEELARLYDEELLNDSRANECYERLISLVPSHAVAEEVLARNHERQKTWQELG